MPMTNHLPRGCSTSRGANDIRRHSSRGGNRPHHTNRLYMLNVRRESLVNKKQTLEAQLGDIRMQIRGIDTDIRETELAYKKLKQNNRTRTRGQQGENSHEVRKLRLQY